MCTHVLMIMILIYSIALAIYLAEAASQQHRLLTKNKDHYLVLLTKGEYI